MSLVQQVQIQKIKTYHHFLIFKIMYLSIIVLSTTSSDSEKQNISSFSDSLLQEVIDWSLTKTSNKDSTFKETSWTSTITILLNCISNTFFNFFFGGTEHYLRLEDTFTTNVSHFALSLSHCSSNAPSSYATQQIPRLHHHFQLVEYYSFSYPKKKKRKRILFV